MLRDPKILEGLQRDQNFSWSKGKENWSPAELSSYVRKRVRLEPVGATPMRRMVYLHADKNFGQYFLKSLHGTTDALIRRTVRRDADEHIAHLQNSIRETKNPDHRRALTSLLMEQERLKMLASVGTPYAAAIIEPASSSARAQWPSNILVLISAIFAGALSGFLLFGFRRDVAQGRGRHVPFSARRWFKQDSGNANRPLTAQKYKENRRDVA